MKKFITLISAVLLVLGANAQNRVFNNPDNHLYVGLRASIGVVTPRAELNGLSANDSFDSGVAPSIGGIVNIPIYANLYVEPGVTLSYKTYSNSKNYFNGNNKFENNSYRNFGIDVPVMVGYHFDVTNKIKLAAFTGPEMRFGITNKYYSDGDFNTDLYSDNFAKRVDFAWKAGVSICFSNLYLGMSESVGLIDISKIDNTKMNLDVFDFTIGYNF